MKHDKHTIMLLNLTEEQIAQLAPDAASVKAGKGLANRTKWVLLEHSDRAIWGHCQGSGKTPYQTVVDTKILHSNLQVGFLLNLSYISKRIPTSQRARASSNWLVSKARTI